MSVQVFPLLILTLALLFAIQIACTVVLARKFWRNAKELYRSLTKQSHGDLANGDGAVFGDWPRIPDDFPTHNGSDTL